MGLLFIFPHTGPGAEADAEFHAADAFQIQCAQCFHGVVEAFVVRVCEGQNRCQQRLETHVQAAVFQQEGNAVRQSFITPGKYPEEFLKKNLPYRVFMADTIYQVLSYMDRPIECAKTGDNSLAFGYMNADTKKKTAAEKLALKNTVQMLFFD